MTPRRVESLTLNVQCHQEFESTHQRRIFARIKQARSWGLRCAMKRGLQEYGTFRGGAPSTSVGETSPFSGKWDLLPCRRRARSYRADVLGNAAHFFFFFFAQKMRIGLRPAARPDKDLDGVTRIGRRKKLRQTAVLGQRPARATTCFDPGKASRKDKSITIAGAPRKFGAKPGPRQRRTRCRPV